MTGAGPHSPPDSPPAHPTPAASGEVAALRLELEETSRGLLAVHAELLERQEELERARAAAERAGRVKDAFLANMSHEIRSPINAVVGFTNLLLDTTLTPEQLEFAQAVRTAADHLLGVIDDILDVSKIESGRLELEEVPFDLYACVEDAVDIVAPKAADKKLPLAVLFGRGLPRTVTGDPLRLRQILVNLIANAVKFTGAGQVRVEVDRVGAADLALRVRDTGIGIRPADTERLFAPFTQADAGIARRHGGTGLGLSICRQLAELMGGTVTVRSVPGAGSTFSCLIPERLGRPAQDPVLSGVQILIVHGEPLVAESLRRHLVDWGASVLTFRSAAQALPAAATAGLAIVDASTLAADLDRLAAAGGRLPIVCATAITTRRVPSAYPSVTTPVRRDRLRAQVLTALGRPPATVQPPAAAAVNPVGAVPLRVLCVDDDPAARRATTLMLKGLGQPHDTVRSVADGRRAVVEAREGDYDVVLMDLHMPVLDGLAAAREIRSGRPPGRPWIVAVTANTAADSRQACLAAGMDEVLTKPVRTEDLARVLAATHRTRTAPAGRAPQGEPDLRSTGRDVLYVDDDGLTRDLVRRILGTEPGLTLRIAPDAATALSLAVERRPDLVLLDLNLPDMGGDALLLLLHEDPRTSDVPVVILSGDANPDTRDRLAGLGACGYLAKPFHAAQLRDLITRPTGLAPR